MAVDILEILRRNYAGTPTTQEESLNDMLAAGAQVEYPKPEPPGLMSQLLAGVKATPETALTLGTGMLAFPIGGLAGGLAAPFVGMDKAAEIIPQVQEALTWHPRGELAAESAELAMKPLEILRESSDWWGKKVSEATGIPELGALVAVIIESGVLLGAGPLVKGGFRLSKSTTLKLRRKLTTAQRTGKFDDPGLTKVLQDALAEAKKDPAMMADVMRFTEGSRRLPPDAGGIIGQTRDILARTEAERAAKPTANEIVRQRMERRRMAKVAGVELPPVETGMRMTPTEIEAPIPVQEYNFGEYYHRSKVDAIKKRIAAGERPSVEVRTGDSGELIITDGIHTNRAYKELGMEPNYKMIPIEPIGLRPTPEVEAIAARKRAEIAAETANIEGLMGKRPGEEVVPVGKRVPTIGEERATQIFMEEEGLVPKPPGEEIGLLPLDYVAEPTPIPKGRKAKKAAKQKVTFESQAEKHGVEFNGVEENVGRFYDPQTQEYFNVNDPASVTKELQQHRTNVAEKAAKYSGVTIEDFGNLVKDWWEGKDVDIIAIRQEVQKFINDKPRSEFKTAADYMEFVDRGEELLGIINQGMRKRGVKHKVGGGVPPKEGLVPAERTTTDGTIYYGRRGDLHHDVYKRYKLDENIVEDGFADSSGEFLTRDEALRTLTDEDLKTYTPIEKELMVEGNGLEGEALRTFQDKTEVKLNDGNISEPKMIKPEDRLAYMKEAGKKRSKLKQEQIEAAIEEGVDITDMLPPEARDAYRTYVELQEQALESSEPRGIGEIAKDLYDVIPTVDPNKVGSGLGGLRGLTHEQKMALQRLVADAKRMVGDLTSYLESIGLNKEQIILIRRHIDEIRKVEPETFGEPRQHWIDARAIAAGDTIIKQTKTRGRQRLPVYKSEMQMLLDAKELKTKKFAGFENPIRTLEQADPAGTGLKEVYYDYRQAEQLYRREFETVKEDIKTLRKDVGWGSRKRIGAYAIAQQARGKNILARMGVDVPVLSIVETQKYHALRGKFEKLFERINTTRELVGREPLEKVDNYFTFFRTFGVLDRAGVTTNPILDRPVQIHSRYAKYGSTPFRFGIERIKKGAIPVELDPFRIYEKYTETALRHIHLSPWVAKMKELMLTLPDPKTGKLTWKLERSKPNLYSFLSEWVNHISGHPSRWQLPRMYERGLARLNRNLAFSVLGANARSALIQVSALRNTLVEIGLENTGAGIIDSIVDIGTGFKNRKFALEHSKILDGRVFDASVQDAMQALRGGRMGVVQEAAGRFALKPLQWLDMETAIATWNGAYKLAKVRKYSNRKAFNFADDVVTRTQASALPGDLAPIQRSALGKTFTLFQTFVINDWGFLTRDVLGLGNVKITNDIALKKVMTYVAATTLFNTLFEVSGIQSPFPTPLRDISDSIEAGDPAAVTMTKVAFGLLDPIPVIGSARYGKGPGGPVVEAVGEAVKSLRGAPMAKPIPETLAVFTGIPGIAQAGKSRRAQERGEGIYGQIVGRYEPTVPSAGRKRGLGGLKGLGKLSGL